MDMREFGVSMFNWAVVGDASIALMADRDATEIDILST